MGNKLTVKERKAIAAMTFHQLVGYCRDMGIQPMGSNHHFMLSEVARHLNVPTDAVSITLVKKNKGRNAEGYSVWHWGVYSEERTNRYRETPDRRWNNACKCNSFTIPDNADPEFIGMLNDLFNKSLIIEDEYYRVEEGTAPAEWLGDAIYDLVDTPYKVRLANVLESFFELRPQDDPRHLALHGEVDPKFRTLFGKGLAIGDDLLSDVEFETKHELLLFRISVSHGRARYLVYSAEHDESLEVLFAESKATAREIARFKETQQRLAHPLIEPNAALEEKLQNYITHSAEDVEA